jgi:hypothetical protein
MKLHISRSVTRLGGAPRGWASKKHICVTLLPLDDDIALYYGDIELID